MGRVKTEILVVESEAIAYANYGHEAKQLYVMWKSGQALDGMPPRVILLKKSKSSSSLSSFRL